MERQDFIDLVKKHFGFLIEEYGFSIVYSSGPNEAFGDCTVVLQSGDCRIRIKMDRGQVLFEAGSRYAPDYYTSSEQWTIGSLTRWYGLTDLIEFLTQRPNQFTLEYPFPQPSGFDEKTDIERQMKELSKTLNPYWDEIIAFFQEEGFTERKRKLDDFIAKWVEKEFGVPPKQIRIGERQNDKE